MTDAVLTWSQRLARYRMPDNRRAILEVAATAVPFAAAWFAMWGLLHVSVWLALLAAIPAAGFLVRLFLIQHDCGHMSFFSARAANDWTGRVLSVLTLTPYDFWKRTHALHHAGHGDLERRGIGDIQTMTVEEYSRAGWLSRLRYRLYRHPLVMFGLGPAYVFLLQYRLPIGAIEAGLKGGRMPWLSTAFTNLGIAAFVAVMIWLVGLKAFLVIQLPLVVIAASIGVWLFYVQHQFEATHWERPPHWTHEDAALHGSSYYDLHPVLMWLTANIGVHHAHHLQSRIPFYKLPRVLKDYPELKTIGRLTLWESIKCVRLTLWDESQKRLISFREYGRLSRQTA